MLTAKQRLDKEKKERYRSIIEERKNLHQQRELEREKEE